MASPLAPCTAAVGERGLWCGKTRTLLAAPLKLTVSFLLADPVSAAPINSLHACAIEARMRAAKIR